MAILTYDQLKIKLIRSTHKPNELVNLAAEHCMKMPEDASEQDKGEALAKGLLRMNHTSPFEHVAFTFQIRNFSRSGLLQLTRHRMASYTVSSQHYQEYSDYPFMVSSLRCEYEEAFRTALSWYDKLIKAGEPKEEARQVLPNAMACGFVMTINARSLVNFLNLRMCKRNCREILGLAWEMRYLVTAIFPELFSYVHADCIMNKCTQGRMSCGQPYEQPGGRNA